MQNRVGHDQDLHFILRAMGSYKSSENPTIPTYKRYAELTTLFTNLHPNHGPSHFRSCCPESYNCLLTGLPAFRAPFKLFSSWYSLHLEPAVLFSKTPSAMSYTDSEIPHLSLSPGGRNKLVFFNTIFFAFRAVTGTK